MMTMTVRCNLCRMVEVVVRSTVSIANMTEALRIIQNERDLPLMLKMMP